MTLEPSGRIGTQKVANRRYDLAENHPYLINIVGGPSKSRGLSFFACETGGALPVGPKGPGLLLK